MKYLLALIATLLLAVSPSASAVEPLINDFAAEDPTHGYELSPSGRYVAWIDNTQSRDRIFIADLSGEEPPRTVKMDSSRIVWLTWARDDRILFARRQATRLDMRQSAFSYVADIEYLFAMNRDGSDILALATDDRPELGGLTEKIDLATVVDVLPEDSDHILMLGYNNAPSLYRVNIETGKSKRIEKGSRATSTWMTNIQGKPVVRFDRGQRRRFIQIKVRAPGDQMWKNQARVYEEDKASFWPVGATSDPNKIYVLARADGADLASLHKFDLTDQTLSAPIASDDTADIESLVLTDNGDYIASGFERERLDYVFEDKTLAAHYSALQDYVGPEESLYINQVSADGNMWLLEAKSPQNPGAWLYYDKANADVQLIAWRSRILTPEVLGRTEIWSYPARDGLNISAYVTMPKNAQGKLPPLVVMPHGGPEARDYYQFDPFAQMLGSKGYAVLQPNFRGSSGFGEDFAEAGYGQWGGAMQDDLTDGVNALIAEGRIDPDRICIAGISYGGYAALTATFLNPDIYKCAIGINGVYDLPEMLAFDRENFGPGSDEYEYMKRTIGDPRDDKERIERLSAQYRAADINMPVLLIHGDKDERVPVEQAQALYAAMEAAGKDVTYEELQGVDHNLQGEINGLFLTLKHMDTFLEEHLQPQN